MSTLGSGAGDEGGDEAAPPASLEGDAIVEVVSTHGLPTSTVDSLRALPTVRQQDVKATREWMRVQIAFAILGGAALSGAAASAAALSGLANFDVVLNGIFTPLLGLTGTVVGFYFGGKDNTA